MLLVIGWVKQVKIGKWQGQYRDAAGKVRFAGTHVRKKDAERATILVEATADAPTSRTTWAEWEKRWVQKVAASTIANDESRLEKWIRPRWNDVALGDIKHVDIQNWIDNIEGQSPSSKRKINAVLSASLRDARKAGLIEHNPAMGVTFDKLPPSPERWLSRPEAEAMRLAIPEGDMREFFDLLIGTGFRFGEAAGLHWDEVDLENHVITAKWSSDRGRGFKPPKSGSYRALRI